MFVDTQVRPQGEQVDAIAPSSKVLLRAVELIERDGWCQHALEDDEGRRCILGAVNVAGCGCVFSNNSPDIQGARRKIRNILGREFVSEWNNEPRRTKEEVISVLRLAAQWP